MSAEILAMFKINERDYLTLKQISARPLNINRCPKGAVRSLMARNLIRKYGTTGLVIATLSGEAFAGSIASLLAASL